ncbi:cocaine- and amphetamine-regulated transcript protein-like [Osmerus eperlanus]|uniref:cocaine- and amphetamine-regulated transcript protein-like n=1 Tax=Osmerus eperlanus TaxID=29151 RepID=UPI002E0DDCF0
MLGSGRHLPLLLWVTVMVVSVLGHAGDLKSRSLTGFALAEERQLINDLQGVLERLKNKRFLPHAKKHSLLPMCDAGEQCALRKGARIGKLCDCQQPRACSSFMLRCL